MDESRRRQYLEAMGIQVWSRRSLAGEPSAPALPETQPQPAAPSVATAIPEPPALAQATPAPLPQSAPNPQPAPGNDPSGLDWDGLRQQVAACRACDLHQSRSQTVFGVGDTQADLVIIGEAPGADEDRQGEPFVGRAGQLLNAMLLAMGLRREQVYIANILKCRPPGNRNPGAAEALRCRPFLQRQLQLLQPRVVLALGGISAQNLLQSEDTIGHLRGRVHRFGEAGIPLVATYHPAYLLRSPAQKARTWQDLQLVLRCLAGVTP